MAQSHSSQRGRRRRLGTARSRRRPRSRRRHLSSQQLSRRPSSRRPPSRSASMNKHPSSDHLQLQTVLRLPLGMGCQNNNNNDGVVVECRWRLAQRLRARQPQAASRVPPLQGRQLRQLPRPASPSSSRSSRLGRQRSSRRRRSSRSCLPRSSRPPGSSRHNRCVVELRALSFCSSYDLYFYVADAGLRYRTKSKSVDSLHLVPPCPSTATVYAATSGSWHPVASQAPEIPHTRCRSTVHLLQEF